MHIIHIIGHIINITILKKPNRLVDVVVVDGWITITLSGSASLNILTAVKNAS